MTVNCCFVSDFIVSFVNKFPAYFKNVIMIRLCYREVRIADAVARYLAKLWVCRGYSDTKQTWPKHIIRTISTHISSVVLYFFMATCYIPKMLLKFNCDKIHVNKNCIDSK